MPNRFLPCLLLAAAVASPAAAEDTVWHVYRGEGGGGTLAVIERAEIESPEPYWRFAMQCFAGEPWTMIVAGIDAGRLGAAIAAGEPVEFSFEVDGERGGLGLGGYFPQISFSEMFGEWEYTVAIDLDTIGELAAAATLALTGTGVDLVLPDDGAAALKAFGAICAALPSEDDAG